MAIVTYKQPVAGLTAPTLAQMAYKNMVIADVTIELYDTVITITHNLALTVAEIAKGWPKVNFEYDTLTARQEQPFVSSVTTNTIVLTVTDFGISSIVSTLRVTIERPASFTV